MQYRNVDRIQNTKFYIGWIVSLLMLLGMTITSYATSVSRTEIQDDVTCYGVVEGQYTKHAETHEIPTDEYWVLNLEGETLTAKWYCTKEATKEEQALYILDVVGDRYVYYGDLVDDMMTIEVDLSSYVDGVYYLQLNNEGNFGQDLTIHRNVRKFTMLKENENVYFIYTQKGAREVDMLRQLNEQCNPEHYNKGVSWLAQEEAKENIAEIENVAKEIVKDCDTDAEKIYAIYEWITLNIAYDNSYENYTAGTTFANRKGICEGQSNLCAIMMQAVNIPCITIRSVREDNHKYNAVYYNGSWRYIDVTNGYYTLPAWCEEWLWTTQSCESYYCSIVDVVWEKRPTKTSFVQGEEFQCDGRVKIKLANGQWDSLGGVTNDSCSGYDTFKLGRQTVTVSIAGKKLTYEITVVENGEQLEKGDKVKADSAIYEVTNAEKKLVTYKKSTSKNAKAIKVSDKVTLNGVTYKVTAIADNAFKGNKKVTKVVLGKNIKTIGKNAFKGCTQLKTLEVKSTTLNKIGANAFDGCKKLTKLILKTTKLTKKSVGKNALKGTNKKLVIKAPKKMVKKYKSYFKNKGNNKVSVKKG